MSTVVLTAKDCALFVWFLLLLFVFVGLLFNFLFYVCYSTFLFKQAKGVIFYEHMFAMSQGNLQSVNVSKCFTPS